MEKTRIHRALPRLQVGRTLAAILAVIFLCTAGAADLAAQSISQAPAHSPPTLGEYLFQWEHDSIRRALRTEISAPLNELPTTGSLYEQSIGARYVHVRYTRDQGAGTHYTTITPAGTRTPTAPPANSPGAYTIHRSLTGGRITQLEITLRAVPHIYARITPHTGMSSSAGRSPAPRSPIESRARASRRSSDGSSLTLYIDQRAIHQGVILPATIDEIMQVSLEQTLEMSSAIIDWHTLLVPAAQTRYSPGGGGGASSSPVLSLIQQIRPHLSLLPDAEDGAMNEHGELVAIATGAVRHTGGGFNCSGFSKWVVDGFYAPLSGGRYLSPAVLSQRQLDQRGTEWSTRWEEGEDPYFGLDWSRALAAELTAARARRGVRGTDSTTADVRTLPHHTYTEDIGYPVAQLRGILYMLALRDDAAVYIGSVNTIRAVTADNTNSSAAASTSGLRKHFHIALFFPYFDADGRFSVTVMERNAESTLEDFMRRQSPHQVHLVTLPIDTPFAPPRITVAASAPQAAAPQSELN